MKIIHWCDALKSMLSNNFCTTQVLKGTFWEIWCIQIQINSQTHIGPKHGAFYLKYKIRVQLQSFLVQLSWRVASHFLCTFNCFCVLANVLLAAKTLGDQPSLCDTAQLSHRYWLKASFGWPCIEGKYHRPYSSFSLTRGFPYNITETQPQVWHQLAT